MAHVTMTMNLLNMFSFHLDIPHGINTNMVEGIVEKYLMNRLYVNKVVANSICIANNSCLKLTGVKTKLLVYVT